MTYPRPCAWAETQPADWRKGWSRQCWSRACETRGCEAKRQDAQRRKAAKSSYRKFPGRPPLYPGLKRVSGICSWCEGAIMEPKTPGQRSKRRGWHDGRNGEPNCLGEYYAHTRSPDMLAWIVDRDGPRCAGCGDLSGRWFKQAEWDADKVRSWGPGWARRYPVGVYTGRFTRVAWSSSLQADHRLCLALVVIQVPEPDRWRWWGPMNLQGLCHACHTAKTREDVAKIKAARLAAAPPPS